MLNAMSRIVRSIGAILMLAAAGGSAHALDIIDVYHAALASDPTFRGAGFDHQASRETLEQARGGYRPAVTLSADGMRTRQRILESDNVLFQTGRSTFDTSVIELTLSQPVFRYANLVRIQQARSEVERADAELEQAGQDLVLRTAESYLFALAAEDQLAYVTAERNAVTKQLELARAREKAQLGTGADRLEAEARLASVEADYSEALVNRRDAYEAISEMTGELPDRLAPLRETFPLKKPEPVDVDHWVGAALEQNWELAVQRKAVEVASKEVRRQRAGHYPTVDLEMHETVKDSGGTVFGGGSKVDTRDVMLSLNVPIYLGGTVSSRTREAEYRRQSAMQELERLRRKVRRDTQSAFSGLMNAIGRVQALQTQVAAQLEVLKLKRAGYRNALYSNLAVLDSERDLYSAKRDLARARYEYLLNSLRLKAVAGIVGEEDLTSLNKWLSH